MQEVKTTLGRLEPLIVRIDATLAAILPTLATKAELVDLRSALEPQIIRIDERLNSTLPHLATKAELADKPGKTFLVGAMALLITVYALGLAGLAALPTLRSFWQPSIVQSQQGK